MGLQNRAELAGYFLNISIKPARQFPKRRWCPFRPHARLAVYSTGISQHIPLPPIMAAIITPTVSGGIIPCRQIRQADCFETSRGRESPTRALIKSSRAVRAISLSLSLTLSGKR